MKTIKHSIFTSKLYYSIKVKRFGFIFFITIISLLFYYSEISAQGGLLITPRRIVFDGSKQIMQLNLANTGQDSARYVISFVQYKMKEDGGFEQISEPEEGQYFADQYLRFFPRSVVLAPNEAQLVKIQLRNFRTLPDGEYRSHIYFRSESNIKPLGETEQDSDSNSFSVRLIPIFGISVPVIIQKGVSTTTVNLSDVVLNTVNDTIPRLNMTFNRQGNMSVYGDITVDYISPNNKTTQVAIARGVAVYTPNALRHFQIDLKKDIKYNRGKLHITYKNDYLKTFILAEYELVLD